MTLAQVNPEEIRRIALKYTRKGWKPSKVHSPSIEGQKAIVREYLAFWRVSEPSELSRFGVSSNLFARAAKEMGAKKEIYNSGEQRGSNRSGSKKTFYIFEN